MVTITYQDERYQCRDDETLLDAFLRQGVDFPFSCRSGACHVCLHRTEAETIPPEAQSGLSAELQGKGYFLPCKCHPTVDMEVLPPEGSDLFVDTGVVEKKLMAEGIQRIRLEPYKNLDYQAGQFLNLRDAEGNLRSYSLASVPGEDYFLELHIRCVPQGKVSSWLCNSLQVGDMVSVQGPEGECYYRPGNPEQPILLIATGTGLAPLLGVARQALLSGHTAPIHLYHGGRTEADCYMHAELLDLAAKHKNFHYTAVVQDEAAAEGFVSGDIGDIALASHNDLHGWTAYLAGAPDMVSALEPRLLNAGLSKELLLTDPFYSANTVPEDTGGDSAAPQEKNPRDIPPDPEMWQALEEGEMLSRLLNDFYSRVYEDPRLFPFFEGVTKQRAVEKQFSFMRQLFTGERVYFGDRPRNAHHWMVISDELFDYREALMVECLRRQGLPEHLITRWRAVEEFFRSDIVKDKPWKKKLGDIELPVDGYEETELEVGSLCDSCGEEIDAGITVRYHLRLGHIYCPGCMDDRNTG
jgi:ferredoxin-NADP reductase